MAPITKEHLKKSQEQNKAVQSWIKQNCKGTIEAPTGWGKNFCSFVGIESVVDASDSRPILILAEVTDREKTYFDDMAKYNKIFGKKLDKEHDFVFACYQSAWKWVGEDFKMVVADI